MSYRKFNSNDILINTMVTHPSAEFYIYNGKVYYNNTPNTAGTRNTTTTEDTPATERNVNDGFINLYEYNIDRPVVLTDRIVGSFIANSETSASSYNRASYDQRRIAYDNESIPVDFVEDKSIIYPFISKDSTTIAPKTVSSTNYSTAFKYGDVMTANYPLSASISREFVSALHGGAFRGPSGSARGFNKTFLGVKNRLDYYGYRSRHYKINSPYGNKFNQALNFIHIPSIFYGSRLQPGSISLKYYVTGTLAGELQDIRQNGELIQVSSSDASAYDNKVAGVVLYDEGLILLTGSWTLNTDTISYGPNGGDTNSRWIYFAAGAEGGSGYGTGNFRIQTGRSDVTDTFKKVSFKINFKGHTETQTLSMFAHARSGEANFSNNPTFISKGQNRTSYSTSHVYQQNKDVKMKNFTSSSYEDFNAPFKRQVFISRIGIYDKNKNLIAIATLANPILKEDKDNYTFKIKFDI